MTSTPVSAARTRGRWARSGERLPRPERGGSALGLVAACLVLAACDAGPSQPARLSQVRLTRVHDMIVARPDLWRVVQESAEGPVQARMMQTAHFGDMGALPSVVMAVPAAIEVDVSAFPSNALLRFAVGLDTRSQRQEPARGVRFGVTIDGEEAFEATRHPASEGTEQQRNWLWAQVPLAGAATLALSVEETGQGPRGDRARALVAGFGALEVVVPFDSHRTRAEADHPNVLVILVDTLRADHLHAYGASADLTPAMDGLARRGTLFARAYAPSSFTWPSTATLMSGLAPPEHGVVSKESNYLAHRIVTLAEVFQANALATGAFSTNPLIAPGKNFDQGFESFEVEPWAHTREIYADVEAWLREHSGSRFFLYLHLTDPHTPYEPDEDLMARLVDDAPEGWEQGGALRDSTARILGKTEGDAALEAWRDHDRALYAAEVAGLDRQLGRLFALLDELQLTDRTLIALTSDHGEEFLEHGNYGHARQLYEESIRIPLILAGPGIPRGQRVDQAVPLGHLGATLVDAAGLSAPAPLGGASLLDAATRSSMAQAPLFFSLETGWWVKELTDELAYRERPIHAVQLGDLRLQWAAGMTQPVYTRLHDLAADPDEQRNLARERPQVAEELRGRIEAWLEAAESRRPSAFGADEATTALLRDIGYLGD